MDERIDRLAALAGGIGPVVVLATVTFGALQSPAYTWPTDPFSIVGGTGTTTALLFNVGLVVAGVCMLPFAGWLAGRYHRAIGGLYGLVGLSFAGAGVFPSGSGLHEPFGAGIMLGIWILLWAAAVVDWRGGRRRAGSVAFVLGTATLAVWLPYDLGWAWAQPGMGGAELVTFLAFAAWSGWMVRRLWDGERNASTSTTAGQPS